MKVFGEPILILNGYKQSSSVRIQTYIVINNFKTILEHIPDLLQTADRDVLGKPIQGL